MTGTEATSGQEPEVRKDLPNYKICACGHDAISHTVEKRDPETGEMTGERVQARCKVNGWDCACDTPRPVLEVSQTFPFKRVSKSSGFGHALYQGYDLLMRSGGTAVWLNDGPTCDKCGTKGSILPYRQYGDFGAMKDILLCFACTEGVSDDEAKRQSRTGFTI